MKLQQKLEMNSTFIMTSESFREGNSVSLRCCLFQECRRELQESLQFHLNSNHVFELKLAHLMSSCFLFEAINHELMKLLVPGKCLGSLAENNVENLIRNGFFKLFSFVVQQKCSFSTLTLIDHINQYYPRETINLWDTMQ